MNSRCKYKWCFHSMKMGYDYKTIFITFYKTYMVLTNNEKKLIIQSYLYVTSKCSMIYHVLLFFWTISPYFPFPLENSPPSNPAILGVVLARLSHEKTMNAIFCTFFSRPFRSQRREVHNANLQQTEKHVCNSMSSRVSLRPCGMLLTRKQIFCSHWKPLQLKNTACH